LIIDKQGARSSVVERAAHNRLVVGSNPTGPTFHLFVWQRKKLNNWFAKLDFPLTPVTI
jgi:hypothetical protein